MCPKAAQPKRPRVVRMAPNCLLKSHLLPVPITLVYQQEDCFAQLMHKRCEGDECPPYREAAGGPAAEADAVCLNTPAPSLSA